MNNTELFPGYKYSNDSAMSDAVCTSTSTTFTEPAQIEGIREKAYSVLNSLDQPTFFEPKQSESVRKKTYSFTNYVPNEKEEKLFSFSSNFDSFGDEFIRFRNQIIYLIHSNNISLNDKDLIVVPASLDNGEMEVSCFDLSHPLLVSETNKKFIFIFSKEKHHLLNSLKLTLNNPQFQIAASHSFEEMGYFFSISCPDFSSSKGRFHTNIKITVSNERSEERVYQVFSAANKVRTVSKASTVALMRVSEESEIHSIDYCKLKKEMS